MPTVTKLQPLDWAHTPTTTAEIEARIEQLTSSEKAIAALFYVLTWNLCAHLTNTVEADNAD